MSANASQLELLQLIHRHLKEFGFHSAANELQRHSPQGDCSVSASLLDIYSSWLNDPKTKMQSPSAKSPNLKKKGHTPEKDSKCKTVNQTTSKDEGDSDSEELSQSLLPQTPLKSCPPTPVNIMATPHRRKEKPAVLFSPLTAISNDSSATTDQPGHVDNTATLRAVEQKKSDKDSTGSTKKVKAAAKKQAKSPKTKDKSKLSSAESAAGTTAKKKTKAAAKTENSKKKSGTVKRKTPAGKDEANVSEAKKSKTQMKEVNPSVWRDDSDSDSSLDVEKWKKLVLDMTDADVVKMDVINALDCSISQPKRRGVRKPAASKETKPPGEEKKIVEEKSTTNTPAKSPSPRKSTIITPAPVTPPADPRQEESSNSVKGQPAAEQNSNRVPLSEEWSEGTTPEPKKKKRKKKEANKDTEEEMKMGSETIGQVSCEKPFEVTKKANGDEKPSENTEHQTMIVQRDEVSDSVVVEEKRAKKAKKKKREKSEQEESQGSSEQISELASEGTDEILPAKKKKKKSKTNVENCEATHKEDNIIPEETLDENSSVVEKGSTTNKSDFQDLSEQIFKKKKRKKDKADRDEATPEQADKDKSESVDINGKIHNESNVKNDPAPLLPLSNRTPQTEKKKKKSKSQSADTPATPQTPGPDSEETSHPEVLFELPSVIHKKKKKHKKTTPEDV